LKDEKVSIQPSFFCFTFFFQQNNIMMINPNYVTGQYLSLSNDGVWLICLNIRRN